MSDESIQSEVETLVNNAHPCPQCGLLTAREGICVCCESDIASMAKTKTYEFTIIIVGDGDDAEEAWRDAVESFIDDPGSGPTGSDVRIRSDDETE